MGGEKKENDMLKVQITEEMLVAIVVKNSRWIKEEIPTGNCKEASECID